MCVCVCKREREMSSSSLNNRRRTQCQSHNRRISIMDGNLTHTWLYGLVSHAYICSNFPIAWRERTTPKAVP